MRRSERITVELSVVWLRGERSVLCAATDMNIHGFFLSTDEDIQPGSLMHLHVALPERNITLFGTARFVGNTLGGRGIGVEVFIIDEESRAAWLSYYHTSRGARSLRSVPPAADSFLLQAQHPSRAACDADCAR